jgi:hypothetical protein
MAPMVTHYRAAWHYERACGTVALVFPDGTEKELENLDAMHFHAITTLLRNERPIQWIEETQTLSTLKEMTGETEINN